MIGVLYVKPITNYPMKYFLILFLLVTLALSCRPSLSDKSTDQVIVSDDITHFWEAYDAIQQIDDTIRQMEILQTVFLDQASFGQQKMMEARTYTAEEYLASIKSRPLFWNSIRKNTEQIEAHNKSLISGVEKLTTIYPSLQKSKIYYTIGDFRSPGTGFDSLVLIGSEFALGDPTINATELPEHVQNYYAINPLERLEFLTVHEYIHTQQKAMVHNLLSLTLYEGIAEFMAIKATGQQSPWKSFTVGPENQERVRQRFEQDMFRPNTIYNWLWNSSNNEFGTNDMSYYVGYQIASLYYSNAPNKELAIKKLIELDYTDEAAVEEIVDVTKYFSTTLADMYEDYESHRPSIVSINPIANASYLQAGRQRITIHFSEKMDPARRGFDYGPLGESNVLRVESVVGFSQDSTSFTFEVNLEKDKRYQSTVTANFVSTSGYPLKPYLIDFETK